MIITSLGPHLNIPFLKVDSVNNQTPDYDKV